MKEVDELIACGVEVIAMDATHRPPPGGETIETLFPEVRSKYPDQLFMADCSNVEEGMKAAALGFDLIGTTMASYTPYTAGCSLPPYGMIKTLVHECGKPVVAEGTSPRRSSSDTPWTLACSPWWWGAPSPGPWRSPSAWWPH
jgi:N-acylglucosamine-6-phosphate 2-epimerase